LSEDCGKRIKLKSEKMSENQKLKTEPLYDDFDETENVTTIVNNIKQEPEVEFLLILPPRHVKTEKVEEETKVKQNGEQTNGKKFQCQQCPKSFETSSGLRQHEKSHKPKVSCEICNKVLRPHYLKAHLKIHESIKKFYCDHCGAGCVTKYELTQHMWSHRSEKQFNCSDCNRGFNRSHGYKTHLQSHSTNPRPFQCDLCPKNYALKEKIKDHLMAIHMNERSFKCNECDYTTKRKCSLRLHKNTHSILKPFSCQVCDKKFKTKGHVRQHQEFHRTTKDCECKTCGKMFRTQSSLKTHETRVHGKNFRFVSKLFFLLFSFVFSCRQKVHLQQMPESFQNKSRAEAT
jgi:C2H2-type zinc-finger domain/C2H2-type zinc finger/Zinc finger, C2H2 type